MVSEELDPVALLGDQLARDPYAAYRRLRRSGRPLFVQHAAVASDITAGRWLLSTYAQARQVLADTTHFTKVSGAYRRRGPEPGFDASMLFQDDPQHRQLRSLVEDLFRRRAIHHYEAMARAKAQRLFETLPVGRPINLMAALAEPLPVWIIADLLGLPDQQMPVLAGLSRAIRSATDDLIVSEASAAEKAAATRTLHDLLHTGLDGAWPLPEESLIRRLQLLLADSALSRDQAISMLILLLFAGHETTSALIGSAIFLLLSHPDQCRRLQADPDLLPGFVEECLRFESPLQRSTFRMTTCELEIDGQQITAGEQVCLLLGSANRDEQAFADAECFQIDRSPNPHLAFGRGHYHCLGRHLSVLEVSVVVQILLQRFPGTCLAGEPIWTVNGFLRCLQDLPLCLQP